MIHSPEGGGFMFDKILDNHYQAYLEPHVPGAHRYRDFDKQQFISSLLHFKLEDEATALAAHFNRKTEFTLTRRKSKVICAVGKRPPENPQTGDYWFDLLELSFMRFIAISDQANTVQDGVWIARHPPYLWQFRSFFSHSRWKLNADWYEGPVDILQPLRFYGRAAVEFATDLYHEEAAAYARWFGKTLVGNDIVRRMKQAITDENTPAMFSGGMRYWDIAEYAGDASLRLVTGEDNLFHDLDEDERLLRQGIEALQRKPNRILYGEWEHHSDISFLLAMRHPPAGEPHEHDRGCVYKWIELLNAVKRA
jgi:hypothetical protein